MPQLEISCHRKKFLSQEETSIHSFVSEWMSGWEDHNLFMERRRCLRRPTQFDVTNDPLFIHADKLLFAAMNKYWRNNGNGEWHFTRTKSDNMFKQSQVLNRLKKQKSKFTFLDIS